MGGFFGRVAGSHFDCKRKVGFFAFRAHRRTEDGNYLRDKMQKKIKIKMTSPSDAVRGHH